MLTAIQILSCLMQNLLQCKKSSNSSRSVQAELLVLFIFAGAVGLRDSEKIRQRAELAVIQ